MTSLTRIISSSCVAAAIAALAIAPAGSAVAATKCSVKGKEQKLGTTYVTTLKVTGVSCSTGERVVKAFNVCRHKKGVAGRCTAKVKRFSCTEKRPAALKGPISYDADVTCKNGAKRVVFHYQQNT
jgi:hypothetical protein